ncbi:endonuclease/exonuclease/phosphatase family protein [Brevibacillus gelatini]
MQLAEGVAGTATEAVQVETRDGAVQLSRNPGRIDPTNEAFASSRKPLAAQFVFQGKSVFVIANHFNSKGGDGALFGKDQPPKLVSEAQRMKIARVVNSFVKQIHAQDPQANVVVLGDLNDFPFSNPVKALADGALVNMVEKLPPGRQYTYVYQGNSQVLDQILVSPHLEKRTKVDIVHINAGFTENEGRVSDHDPVLVQIRLQAQDEHETTAQEVADGITSLAQPAAGATRLRLPEVPAGFTVAIKHSSNTGVIALDGTITPPSRQTDVELILQVTRESDGTTATTEKLTVHVPARPTTPPPVNPPDTTPMPDRQKDLHRQAEQAILSAADEQSIEEQVQRVLASLQQLFDAKQVTQAEKWDAVSHFVSTVLAAVVEQAERGIIREKTLHELSESFLDEAFVPLAKWEKVDTELARLGLTALTNFAKTALEPFDSDGISKDVAKRVRLLAETLLKRSGTIAVEPGDEIKASDEQIEVVLDTLTDFMEAIEGVQEKIGFSPVLFIRMEGDEGAYEPDTDTDDHLRSKKAGSEEQAITLEKKLVELLKKKEVGVRLTVPAGAWVEVPGAYFARERAGEFSLHLTEAEAKANGWKGVSNPGKAYSLEAWSNGKEMGSFGERGFTLALPLAFDAGEKLQAYTYRNKQWRAVTGEKGKPPKVSEEDGMGVFTVKSAASYVVGDAVVEALEVKPQSLKLAPGEKAQLEVLAIFSDKSSEDVTKAESITYESNRPEQVEVDEEGRVVVLDDAEARTRATITINYGGKRAKVYVFVRSAEK